MSESEWPEMRILQFSTELLSDMVVLVYEPVSQEELDAYADLIAPLLVERYEREARSRYGREGDR
ncbi:hypothetical protein [Microbacterium album]|uniref:Uncharacterized protein n=1 Tax=Microbacterium album TaxID=2053191 RepID=A0A917IJJ6_9MICO|nr:hypothetical protein [Microbacterium album]GGH51287.1 hypothetical protein GCM10010921_30630 [Microbacterium album]